jgi:hypothetical protein
MEKRFLGDDRVSDTNGDFRPYHVEFSDLVVEQFKKVLSRAIQRGLNVQFADSTLRIMRALRESPEQFGEPLYSLAHTQQQVRLAVVGPLSVTLAVHSSLRIVFIREFKLVG